MDIHTRLHHSPGFGRKYAGCWSYVTFVSPLFFCASYKRIRKKKKSGMHLECNIWDFCELIFLALLLCQMCEKGRSAWTTVRNLLAVFVCVLKKRQPPWWIISCSYYGYALGKWDVHSDAGGGEHSISSNTYTGEVSFWGLSETHKNTYSSIGL